MNMPAKRRRPAVYRGPRVPRDDSSYMMRGMMDMSKMAVGGMVGVSMVSQVGSLLKKD